jgi:hypothetical protein
MYAPKKVLEVCRAKPCGISQRRLDKFLTYNRLLLDAWSFNMREDTPAAAEALLIPPTKPRNILTYILGAIRAAIVFQVTWTFRVLSQWSHDACIDVGFHQNTVSTRLRLPIMPIQHVLPDGIHTVPTLGSMNRKFDQMSYALRAA